MRSPTQSFWHGQTQMVNILQQCARMLMTMGVGVRSAGWLLDDGVCTVTCSEPDEAGVRQCGRGAAFENSQDSIDCSGCVKLEDECGQCVMWGTSNTIPANM
eukprot:3565482-Amphidinium_carterae.1